MNHISWLLADWAERRRDATEFTARQFAKFGESRLYKDSESIAELWDQFKAQAWNINASQSGLEHE